MTAMFKSLKYILTTIVLCFFAQTVGAQAVPVDVSFCQLAKSPKEFDGKTIRVRGTLSINFEDFTLYARDCKTDQWIWLTFGGDVPGIVVSMVNDNYRKPGKDLEINGVTYGIKKDDNFRRLYAMIAARRGQKPAYTVTATLTGAFLAGQETKAANGKTTSYSGYGHLGCCSLLVITQVSDVSSVPPADLTVRGTVLGPDAKPMKGITVVNEVRGGTPPERQQTRTDEKGKFTFSDAGQLLRVEDPHYRPVARYLEPGSSAVLVRLEESKGSDWAVPSCDQVKDAGSRIGFSARFALPSGRESTLMNEEGLHAYFLYPRGDEAVEAELIISSNPEQEEDKPDRFADSKTSEQRWIKDGTGKVIGIDARGVLKTGGRWRTAVLLGHDSIRYTLRPGKSTGSMDQVIDSACIGNQ
jgi:hypothetical protein